VLALLLAGLLAWPPAVRADFRGSAPSSPSFSLPVLFDRALAASREGRFGEALPLWNQVLELAPEDASAWSNRGNVQLALGDARAAIADQDRAIALEPNELLYSSNKFAVWIEMGTPYYDRAMFALAGRS
jgi:tetratricopeptide (TPR) repeat protein